jgi:hypothetical protein
MIDLNECQVRVWTGLYTRFAATGPTAEGTTGQRYYMVASLGFVLGWTWLSQQSTWVGCFYETNVKSKNIDQQQVKTTTYYTKA